MPYTAVRFDTDDADAWSDALLAAGALSVEATDPFAGTPQEQARFNEPGDPVAQPWQLSRLVALFDAGFDVAGALGEAAGALAKPLPVHQTYAVEDQDWVRATQSQFGPIAIADRLHIVPTWCEPPQQGVVIRLDPGLAFGTGSHPTTHLCLEWLLEQLHGGESLLDYGCGSGVLAIAAAKLGATLVIGTDVDPQALNSSRANAQSNRVDAAFVVPDALPARDFDIVVANILANPLILLAPAIAARVRPGGRLALSGILDSQVDAVVIAYSRWFKLAACRRADGWALLSGERSALS
jgi:ribosomal protein L11 methyltransferase